MDHLTFISDRNILIFLIQILCILVTAKILAIPLRRAGLPVFPAEMLAGVFLGPTVLGQFFPELFHMPYITIFDSVVKTLFFKNIPQKFLDEARS